MAKSIVFVVDPDLGRRTYLESFFSEYTLFLISSYHEALSFFKENHSEIRVVLLSLDLEGQRAFSLLEQFKHIYFGVQVITYSKEKDIHLVVQAIKAGAYEFVLEEQFDDELNSVVSEAINASLPRRCVEEKASVFTNKSDVDDLVNMLYNLLTQSSFISFSISVDYLLSLFTPLEFSWLLTEDMFPYLEQQLSRRRAFLEPETVLVVEDEDVYRTMLVDFLSGIYKVQSVALGVEALKKVKEDDSIHIVLLDIFLPDVLGSEILVQIRKCRPDVQVIMLTAFELMDKAISTLREGAVDFLSKPVLKKDLLLSVSEALKRRLFVCVLPELKRCFMERWVSDSRRVQLLKQVFEEKKTLNKTCIMGDVYEVFPELRSISIPEGMVIPSLLLEKGVDLLIDDLKLTLSQATLKDLPHGV